MKEFDKENVTVNSDDCFRWSRKLVKRLNELHSRQTLTVDEQEEYRMILMIAHMLDEVGNDLVASNNELPMGDIRLN